MEIVEKMNNFMDPIREKRTEWAAQEGKVRKILDKGRDAAIEVASKTLHEALQAVGVRK